MGLVGLMNLCCIKAINVQTSGVDKNDRSDVRKGMCIVGPRMRNVPRVRDGCERFMILELTGVS